VVLFWIKVKWSEVKWVTAKFLGTKVPCTLGWPYTEGIWLYCDYFNWVYLVLLLFQLFCNVWVCVCVSVVVICVLVFTVFCTFCTVFFVLFRLCIFILICFVCTSVRTTATEWKLNCSSSNSSSSSSSSSSKREQHTRKTWSQGTPENSHIGHCTHTSESTNVKVQ